MKKDALVTYDRQMPLGDRKTLSLCLRPSYTDEVKGLLLGLVVKTEIGQIASMLSATKQEQTPPKKTCKLLGIITIIVPYLLLLIQDATL